MDRRDHRQAANATQRVKAELRYELKYLLTLEQAAAVRAALTGHLQPDRYGDADGSYTITSLYFDTPDLRAYWDKLQGHKIRRKVRVRIYGRQVVTEATPVYLEVKHRIDKQLSKRRVLLPYGQAMDLDALALFRDAGNVSGGDLAVVDEVYQLYRTLALQPTCVVRYDRLAFDGGDHFPDLRVTFDTNLRGRNHDLTLLSEGYADDRFILPAHRCVLEVKVNRSVPYWLAQVLSTHRCTLRRISKYCATLETCAAITARQRIVEIPT